MKIRYAFLVAVVLVIALGVVLNMMEQATKNSTALPQAELDALASESS